MVERSSVFIRTLTYRSCSAQRSLPGRNNWQRKFFSPCGISDLTSVMGLEVLRIQLSFPGTILKSWPLWWTPVLSVDTHPFISLLLRPYKRKLCQKTPLHLEDGWKISIKSVCITSETQAISLSPILRRVSARWGIIIISCGWPGPFSTWGPQEIWSTWANSPTTNTKHCVIIWSSSGLCEITCTNYLAGKMIEWFSNTRRRLLKD